MKDILPENLIRLAQNLPLPLYLVGGAVRDFVAGFFPKHFDFDLAAPIPVETVTEAAVEAGLQVCGVYKNTGTVKLQDADGNEYEYTRFRQDKYIRGVHTPSEIVFTDDVEIDARRRDFTVNAVYYDMKNFLFVDPLGGIEDVRAKRLRTVDKPEKVFGEDGLRLMRLARQAAQLGFIPTADCLWGAKQNAHLIQDISKERIYHELLYILQADKKYGNKAGHYEGLKLLDEIGVFALLFPELAMGKGQMQRQDFHDYDVLEHTFRAVLYAPEEVRLAALLHDVGKPFTLQRDGNTFLHAQEGGPIADAILKRLGAPNKVRIRTVQLVALHMYDFNRQTGEDKLRRFFVENYPILEQLMMVKQADFSACKDDLSIAPTVEKWQSLLAQMKREKTPLSLKQLAVNGTDFLSAGCPPTQVGVALKNALLYAVCAPKENTKERLVQLLPRFLH